MSKLDKVRSNAIAISLIVMVAGMAAMFFFMTESGRNFLGDKTGEGSLAEVDFPTMTLLGNGQEYLICSAQICQAAKAHAKPIIFDVDASTLMQAFADYSDDQSSIRTRKLNLGARQIDFLITSPNMDFPDAVTMRFINTKNGASMVLVYSRSLVGSGSSASIHAARIDSWIEAVQLAL